MVIWLSLVICILGLVLYVISTNGKVQTLARDCFWVGLLVFLLHFGGQIALK